MAGMRNRAPAPTIAPSPATAKKGSRHPPACASQSPVGTPRTEATETAPMTTPMARPRLSGGTLSATMAKERDVAGPPKSPAATRDASSVPSPVASPATAVAATSPAMATASAERRSKRSRKPAPAAPAAAAASV